jgi:hypothetical protein
MSVILLLNKKLLYEAPVSGDKTAKSVVKARGHLEKAKERLSNLGIHDIPSLDGVNTIEQLKIEPFKLSFLVQVKDNQEELTEPKPKRVDCLARVINEKPLTLECKSKSDGKLFTLEFIKDEELNTRLPGTKKGVRALETQKGNNNKGKFYSVIMDNTNQGGEGDGEGKGKGNGEGDGEGKGNGEGNGGGSKNTEKNKVELYNDLGSFFKFVYNNRRGMRNESKINTFDSFVNRISDSLLILEEEDDVEEEPTKILINRIQLGPKAEARRNADEANYEKIISNDGANKWDGKVYNLPSQDDDALNASVNLTLVDESQLNDNEKEAYNIIVRFLNNNKYSGNVRIRRSQKKSEEDTTFILIFGDGTALVAKTLKRGVNLKDSMLNNEILISPRAGDNEVLTKHTKAYIQVVTR